MTTNGFTTCLWLDGRAEEAADYYVSVFEDSAVGRVIRNSDAAPGEPRSVLTVEFTANGQRFVALNAGPQFTFNEAVSFQVICADQAEVDHYWKALTDGGEDGPCGWVKDRFGLSWQVVPEALLDMIADPDPVKAQRTTQEMFTMKKLDIAALRKAHSGG